MNNESKEGDISLKTMDKNAKEQNENELTEQSVRPSKVNERRAARRSGVYFLRMSWSECRKIGCPCDERRWPDQSPGGKSVSEQGSIWSVFEEFLVGVDDETRKSPPHDPCGFFDGGDHRLFTDSLFRCSVTCASSDDNDGSYVFLANMAWRVSEKYFEELVVVSLVAVPLAISWNLSQQSAPLLELQSMPVC